MKYVLSPNCPNYSSMKHDGFPLGFPLIQFWEIWVLSVNREGESKEAEERRKNMETH